VAVPPSIDGSPPGSAVHRSCPNTGLKIEKTLKIEVELVDSAFAGWKSQQRYQQENRPIQKTSYFRNISGCFFPTDSVPDKEDFPFDMEFRSWRIFFVIGVC